MSQSSGTPPRAALLRATLRRAAASRLGSNFQLPSGVAGFNLAKHRANPTQEEVYFAFLYPLLLVESSLRKKTGYNVSYIFKIDANQLPMQFCR